MFVYDASDVVLLTGLIICLCSLAIIFVAGEIYNLIRYIQERLRK